MRSRLHRPADAGPAPRRTALTQQSQLSAFETAAIGTPITRLGVSFFPVYLMGDGLPAITTGRGAGLVIEELDDASVQNLLARNPTDKPILVVEGEHFLGGKQNRAINGTVLVPPKTDLTIPVSCLEQGRWGRPQEYARARAFAPRRVRARKELSVARSMRSRRSLASDQTAVWGEVNRALTDSVTASATRAASDIDAAIPRESVRGEAIRDLVDRGPLPRQSGVVVTHGRRVAAIELFGSPDLLKPHWEALVRSYLGERVTPRGRPSPRRVLRALRRFGTLRPHKAPGVGLGTTHRVEDDKIVGQTLTLEGAFVHASAFARP